MATRVLPWILALIAGIAVACAARRGPVSSGEATAAPVPSPSAPPESDADAPTEADAGASILLDGAVVRVRWSDGDSFKFLDGPYKGSGVRMTRYNTLESYGPVHRWGSWTAAELYAIARTSKEIGKSQQWTCTTAGEKDGYGRVLVDCPDAALASVVAGHGHVYTVEGEGDPALLAAQAEAQQRGVGIWRKGVPQLLLTSLHSADEGGAEVYNRAIDTRTGASVRFDHQDIYAVCQEVCVGAEVGSCLTYVPFNARYRNKPDCLRSNPQATEVPHGP